MNRFLLCGHSGSMNRGADVIPKYQKQAVKAVEFLVDYYKDY